MSGCRAALDGRGARLGLRLCVSCRNRLASQLSGLPASYQECEEALQHRADHSAGRVSGWWPGGICLDEAALAIRADMADILASWCQLVVGERGVAGPGNGTVGLLAAFLRVHLKWLGAHPAAADFAAEVAALVTAAAAVNSPDPGLTMDLGPCAQVGCDRIVRATIRGQGQSPAGRVRCDAGHVSQPDQWLLLGQRTESATRRVASGTPVRAAKMVS